MDAYSATATGSTLLFSTGTLKQGAHTVKMRLTGEKRSAATGIAAQVDYATVTTDGSESATAWAGLPQPTKLDLTGVPFPAASIVRIFLPRDASAGLRREGERLSSELAGSGAVRTAPAIVAGDAEQIRAGEIVLRTGERSDLTSDEGYTIAVSDRIEVAERSPRGVFTGTRQILQNLTANGSVPGGRATSNPAVGERSLHIDAARKFYTKDWLAAQIRDMSYVGLNTLQLHFSENEGFRIASDTHPEMVSAQALSKADVRELIALARDLYIQVVPSLDMPGHLTQALLSHPDLRLKDANGNDARGALEGLDP